MSVLYASSLCVILEIKRKKAGRINREKDNDGWMDEREKIERERYGGREKRREEKGRMRVAIGGCRVFYL